MCFNNVRVHATCIRYGLSSTDACNVGKMREARESVKRAIDEPEQKVSFNSTKI